MMIKKKVKLAYTQKRKVIAKKVNKALCEISAYTVVSHPPDFETLVLSDPDEPKQEKFIMQEISQDKDPMKNKNLPEDMVVEEHEGRQLAD
ncbi:hypothetical protein RYX36_021861 [Vicia faba]